MEPISIAASILTIIGALGLAVRLPDKIAALRHAPELTEALRQETLLVSHEVNEAYGLLQEAKAWSLASPDSLPVALENLNVAVAKLNSLIDRCLERQENGLMNYYRCYRSQKQLEALLGRIQRGRVALVSAKATLNFDLGGLIRSDVRFSGFTLGRMIFSAYLEMQRRFDRLDTSGLQDAAMQMLPALPGMHNQIVDRDTTSMSDTRDAPANDDVQTKGTIETSGPENAPDVCPSHCCCRCHDSNTIQTPAFLSSVMGELLVGYNTTPWSRESCNESHCRRTTSHTTFLYAFPTWLLHIVLVCSVNGPELSLRMMNVRDPSWTFRGLIMFHDRGMMVQETKRQLGEQELSVRDVTSDNATALHLAMHARLTEVSKVLVAKGADIHYKDRYNRSPYMIAWERRWTRPVPENEDLAPNFFADRSHFVDFKFTELHQAYLGITASNFQHLVSTIPRPYIDKGDRQNRTALSWAAARNDHEAVRRLLLSRADPDMASVDGWTPLHYAAEADGTEALELLLAAKAEIDATTKTGRTPLHMACANPTVPAMMDRLIERGADLNKKGRNGFTPLEHTFVRGSVAMTKRLLDAGARCGLELVNWAIYHNAHEALALLLAKWDDIDFDQEGEDDDEDPFHYVAYYASMQTVEVLTTSWPGPVDTSVITEGGKTIREAAKWRRDSNIEWSRAHMQVPDKDPQVWFTAFEGMVEAIRARRLNAGTPCESEEEEDGDILAEDYYSSEESFTSTPDEDETDD